MFIIMDSIIVKISGNCIRCDDIYGNIVCSKFFCYVFG